MYNIIGGKKHDVHYHRRPLRCLTTAIVLKTTAKFKSFCFTFCICLVFSAWRNQRNPSVVALRRWCHDSRMLARLCVNIYLCLSPPCSLQHCLNRTSPCMWQCLYPILMPCTSLERLLEARSWLQLQPLSVTMGCCPLHRLLSIGIWPQVEVLRDPPVKAVQVNRRS